MPSRRQCSELARNRHRHTRFAPVSSSARAAGRRPALFGWGADSDTAGLAMSAPLIERFRDRLPVSDATPVVSLGEGSTPLLRAPRLGERLGVELWLKWEASNPTGELQGSRHDRRRLQGGRGRRPRRRLRLDREHLRVGGRVRRARRARRRSCCVAESAARGKLIQARGARRTGARGARDVRPGPRRSAQARRERRLRPRQLAQPEPGRGPAHGGVRDRRGARLRAGRLRPPVRRGRQHDRVHESDRRAGPRFSRPLRGGRRPPTHPGERDPHRDPGPRRDRRRERRERARGLGRGHRRGVARARARGGPVLRAVVCGRARLSRAATTSSAAPVSWCTITGHGLKDPGAADFHAPPPIVVDPEPDAIARALG